MSVNKDLSVAEPEGFNWEQLLETRSTRAQLFVDTSPLHEGFSHVVVLNGSYKQDAAYDRLEHQIS